MKPLACLTRVENVPNTEACRDLARRICEGIRDCADIAVLGISGGADSTLVATLSTMALGAHRVYGISMPYGSTDVATFNSRSRDLAVKLGLNHATLPIRLACNEVYSSFPPLSDLNAGNARSRMRMVFTYTHCCNIGEANPGLRARVMGTGNLSEDYIGYDTKGGDALADYFPIGELYKQEVYDLLDYLVGQGIITDDLIDRVPSAGLWEGQTDEAELGHTYNEMAPAIEWLREHNFASLGVKQQQFLLEGVHLSDPTFYHLLRFVHGRHVANQHKHLAPPVLQLRYPPVLQLE